MEFINNMRLFSDVDSWRKYKDFNFFIKEDGKRIFIKNLRKFSYRLKILLVSICVYLFFFYIYREWFIVVFILYIRKYILCILYDFYRDFDLWNYIVEFYNFGFFDFLG